MTMDIALTFLILVVAILLFVTEKLRPDIVAILIMVTLPWTGIISVSQAFSGFSSNAVISVIAVMMMGYGIDKSGLMQTLSRKIVKIAGDSEKRILVLISTTVGVISSFMQNIGAAALFLPAVRRIAANTKIHPSKLLMPMGFAAILGGTLTMVASGPLIVLNDLIGSGDYERFGLFEVTPVGVALLGSGILYFYFFGGKVLPNPSLKESQNHQDFLKEIYELPDNIYEVIIKEESTILDQTIESLDIWEKYNLHILALYESGSIVYAPWRKTRFHKEQILAILGKEEQIKAFVDQYDLEVRKNLAVFANIKNEQYAGFAEIIVPPKSELKGKTLWEIAVRKNFSIEPISYINQAGERINCFKEPLEPGQELLVFGRWEDITKLKDSRDLVVVTEISHVTATEGAKKNKQALFSLTVAIILVLLGVRLSLGFFTGALLMILLGVIPKDEIYQAVDWKTVFLLAGLIPLGGAFEQSGAANLTADIIMGVIHSWGVLPILFVIGLLATFFSLFMSNVAAAVLLVPLVLIMGENFGIDPRGMALLVAVCTSNSFVLPTHQVNAFIMTPGGYKNADYMKAGGMMTIVFLVVAVFMIYLFYI